MSNITPPGEDVLAQLGIDPTTIKLIKPHWKRTHYRAISNWLTQYQPPSNASNFDKIKGYIEAFRDLCELEEWEKAAKIIILPIQGKELHLKLETWGYYYQEIELYKNLLGKLNVFNDFLYLKGLGNAYNSIGNYDESIKYFKKCLQISQQHNQKQFLAKALGGLGNVYCNRGNYRNGINYLKKSLVILREIKDQAGEARVLGNLGAASIYLEKYQEAIDYYNQSLKILEKIDDINQQVTIIVNLITIYTELKKYSVAYDYAQKYFRDFKNFGTRQDEQGAWLNLGNLYYFLAKYESALDCYEKFLLIAKETGDRQAMCQALGSLGNFYQALNKYDTALDYQQQSLTISQQIGSLNGEATAWFNIGLILARQNQKWDAVEAFNKAQNLYEIMEIENKVQDCKDHIKNIGKIITTIPIMAPEIGNRSEQNSLTLSSDVNSTAQKRYKTKSIQQKVCIVLDRFVQAIKKLRG